MGRLLVVLVLSGLQVLLGASQSTGTDYDRVETVGDCVNIFDRLTTQNPNISCSLLQPYLKCLIRVIKLYTYPVGSNKYTALDNQVNANLRALGFNCQFDSEAIAAEVAREQNGRAIPTTARPEHNDRTSPITTISHWSDRDYDRDQTVGDCINTVTRMMKQNPNLSCSLFQPYLKCLIRVTKHYTHPVGSDEYTALDNQVNAQLRPLGINCHFDIEAISAEVAREQNYRNSDPGFKMSGAGILLLLLSWICSYFVQF